MEISMKFCSNQIRRMEMFEFVNDNTLAEYEAFNMSHPFGHFAQSKKWANLKDNWKWEAVIVRDENGATCRICRGH